MGAVHAFTDRMNGVPDYRYLLLYRPVPIRCDLKPVSGMENDPQVRRCLRGDQPETSRTIRVTLNTELGTAIFELS